MSKLGSSRHLPQFEFLLFYWEVKYFHTNSYFGSKLSIRSCFFKLDHQRFGRSYDKLLLVSQN